LSNWHFLQTTATQSRLSLRDPRAAQKWFFWGLMENLSQELLVVRMPEEYTLSFGAGMPSPPLLWSPARSDDLTVLCSPYHRPKATFCASHHLEPSCRVQTSFSSFSPPLPSPPGLEMEPRDCSTSELHLQSLLSASCIPSQQECDLTQITELPAPQFTHL
jgi:hypothetical protein